MACIIARFLDEKIAKDISILNISNVSSFADYFVICSAQSNTQVKALTENLADKIKQTFSRLPWGKKMMQKTAGILLITVMLLFIFFIKRIEKLMLLKNFGVTLLVFPVKLG